MKVPLTIEDVGVSTVRISCLGLISTLPIEAIPVMHRYPGAILEVHLEPDEWRKHHLQQPTEVL